MPFVDSFIATAGVLLFAAGLLHCVLPHSFRLGVILLLLADILFALDIACSRYMAVFWQSLGFDPQQLNARPLLCGILLAVVLLLLCYLICVQLLRFTPFWRRVEPKKPEPESAAGAARSARGRTDPSDRGGS